MINIVPIDGLPLREGSRGAAVLEMQLLLTFVGLPPGPCDGIFGPRTRAAVLQWLSKSCSLSPAEVANASAEMDDDNMADLRATPRLGVQVERVRTPATWEQLRAALEVGLLRVVDLGWRNANHGDVIRVAGAHLAEENWDPIAQAYENIWTFNLGNRQVRHDDISHSIPAGPVVPWFSLVSREIRGGQDKMLVSPYYASASLREGAEGYFRALVEHCPRSWDRFLAGDPAGAARELKGEWRYTGDERDYERGMVDRFKALA